jgi:flagellar biosynthesis/type III secretory pathway ATPase
MRSVAEQFSLDPTTLSRSVSRLERKIADPEFSQLIASVKKTCKKYKR